MTIRKITLITCDYLDCIMRAETPTSYTRTETIEDMSYSWLFIGEASFCPEHADKMIVETDSKIKRPRV